MCEGQIPLFEQEVTTPVVAPRWSGPVAWAACPLCLGERVEVVVAPNGSHLSWQVHTLTTGALQCQASGQHLCDFPARVRPGDDTPLCSH